MKNTTTIKTILGLTQEEMAMLLGITRGQWSMYDAGKRDLPLPTLQKLTGMLLHKQNTKETSPESQKFSKAEQIKAQEWLAQEHRSLELKKRILDRKIATIENKRTACYAALETVHFLETQQPNETDALLESIKMRAKNTLNKFPLHQLQDLQIKKEQLEMLKSILEQKIKEKENGL